MLVYINEGKISRIFKKLLLFEKRRDTIIVTIIIIEMR